MLLTAQVGLLPTKQLEQRQFMKSYMVGLLLALSMLGAQSQSLTLLTDPTEHWIGGETHGVRFNASGLIGATLYVNLIPIDQVDGGYRISTTTVGWDGNDTDAFTVRFSIPSGRYNVMLVAEIPNVPRALIATRGTGVITISSAITSPAAGETLKQGKTYMMTWPGREPGIDGYSVYLVGGSLGDTDAIFLGDVPADQGWFEWTVPKDLASGVGFRLQLSGRYASGADSEPFNIIHDHRRSTRF